MLSSRTWRTSPSHAEGSWTEHFGLDTGPVSYADSISPDHYALEQDAIFRKTWLNVGRVEQLPRKGSYFTKELDAANTSVVLVRDMEDEVRAFHNMCRHRGNKLVWNDYPGEETSGICRQFTCKYHGWRYGLEGQLTFIQQEDEFFDLDKADFGLAPVNVDVWEGFIFVNFDPDAAPLKDYLGRLASGIEGYPFHLMTQKHTYRAEIGANWKLFIDAFMEFYHAPVLHAKQAADEESRKLQGFGYEALAYDVDGPHSMVSSWGGMSPPKDLSMVKPIERVLRSGLFGVWDAPDIGELPEGLNPARHPAWGEDSFLFFPNFTLLIWKPNWYLTYHYWPTSYNTHIFECVALLRAPDRTPTSGCSRSWPSSPSRSTASRTATPWRPPRSMLESGAVTEFPLCDQEVLLRHLHTTARRLRGRARRRAVRAPPSRSRPRPERSPPMPTLPADFADLEPFADWALPSEADRYAKRLASSMDELQAFYDAAFPRLEDGADYLKSVALDGISDEDRNLLWLFSSLVTVSFPVEVWRQARVPDSGASSFDVTVEPVP